MADEWYYASNGQPIGPVSSAALREMAASGTLLPTALVWKEGMSQWAPASATRGLFPTPVQAQAPARFPAPAPPAPEPPPEHHPYGDDEDVAQASVPARVKRGAGGMSSGAKAAMVGGIVFVLALALMVGIVVAVLVASTPANRSYTVNLNFEGQEDIRFLQFRQNQRVHITVTTGEWGGAFEPDVDLFVIDPNGNLVAEDTRPDKDCVVSFVADQTGMYKIVIVLDSGNWVRCTVRY